MPNDDDADRAEDVSTELSGWLMKRCRLTKKWKKTWFTLHSSQLSYGKSEAVSLVIDRV